MTKTQLSKDEVLRLFPHATNLGIMFKEFENHFALKGEVICQFKINGMSISETEEQKLSGIDLTELEAIEIESESPSQLLFQLLDNWINELPILIQSTDELASEIRYKGIEGYLKSFVDLIDSCQFLVDSLLNLEGIVKRESVNHEQWKKNEEMTARAIGEAIDAFQRKDFVKLAEVLEYELANSLQVWLEEIKNLSDYLKSERNKDSDRFAERIFNKNPDNTKEKDHSS